MKKNPEEINSEVLEGSRGFWQRPFVLGLLDFLLLNTAFFAVYWWKYGTLNLSTRNERLLILFWLVWLLVSLLTSRFRIRHWPGYRQVVWDIAKSGLYLAYCMAVMVVLLGVYALSRGQIFGACLVLMVLEWALFSILYQVYSKKRGRLAGDRQKIMRRPERISIPLVLIDMGLVGLSFLIVNYFKRDGFQILPDYEWLLLLIYGVWFGASALTRKFEQAAHLSFQNALWPWVKAAVLMFLTLALIIFLFRFTHFSRTQVFGTILLLSFFEGVLCAVYYFKKQPSEEDIETTEERRKILRQEILPLRLDMEEIRNWILTPIREGLRDRALKDNPALFDFLDKTLNLSTIVRAEMVLRDSSELLRWDLLDGQALRLIINLHKLNDIRWVNRYLLEAHGMLQAGGWLVVMAHTIQTHREWLYQQHPRVLANILYALDFVIHRAAPKMPWIKQIYFSVTKGKNRALSRAEVLGRLHFCGFGVVAEKEIDKRLYVVAQKMRTPSLNTNPTYGPFVELKRVGANGKVLSIYKFRTMHPYAEFLQDYVYEKHGLQKGGKLGDDFRVTEWGRVMRRLWLDELPMLYNWIKGDLKLFGVRPLSYHYLSLYPQDLQELRMRVTPGLVPPFYADLPEDFEAICESERRYIHAYLQKPLRTQLIYFCKAFYNIVFKGARSH